MDKYDLSDLKFIVKNDYIIVKNNEKMFIFLIFYNKNTNKRDVLFKEIQGDKINLQNVIMIKNIINNIKEYNYYGKI